MLGHARTVAGQKFYQGLYSIEAFTTNRCGYGVLTTHGTWPVPKIATQ